MSGRGGPHHPSDGIVNAPYLEQLLFQPGLEVRQRRGSASSSGSNHRVRVEDLAHCQRVHEANGRTGSFDAHKVDFVEGQSQPVRCHLVAHAEETAQRLSLFLRAVGELPMSGNECTALKCTLDNCILMRDHFHKRMDQRPTGFLLLPSEATLLVCISSLLECLAEKERLQEPGEQWQLDLNGALQLYDLRMDAQDLRLFDYVPLQLAPFDSTSIKVYAGELLPNGYDFESHFDHEWAGPDPDDEGRLLREPLTIRLALSPIKASAYAVMHVRHRQSRCPASVQRSLQLAEYLLRLVCIDLAAKVRSGREDRTSVILARLLGLDDGHEAEASVFDKQVEILLQERQDRKDREAWEREELEEAALEREADGEEYWERASDVENAFGHRDGSAGEEEVGVSSAEEDVKTDLSEFINNPYHAAFSALGFHSLNVVTLHELIELDFFTSAANSFSKDDQASRLDLAPMIFSLLSLASKKASPV
ncbi:hypothetical protein CBOM_03537 [Ceraceosorus bombacis]|uniref:Uncharacterized protein n=1 Tax=Ceraceosorus bombacis TaxID=401625 RepID=A0A0P1BG21_9BASI|nr:hypothetical protein CBOM_03537 [Ceraceosorus bombacis]